MCGSEAANKKAKVTRSIAGVLSQIACEKVNRQYSCLTSA